MPSNTRQNHPSYAHTRTLYRNMAKGREFHPMKKFVFLLGRRSVICFFIGHAERQLPPTKWPRGAAHQKWNDFYFFFFSFFSFWWWHLREFLVWVTNWSAVLIWREEQKYTREKKVKMLCANHEMVGKRIIDERNSWYYHTTTIYPVHVKHSCPVTLSASLGHFSAQSPSSIVLSLSFSISFSILIFLYSFLKLFFSFCAFVWFHRLFVGMAYSQPRHTHTHTPVW